MKSKYKFFVAILSIFVYLLVSLGGSGFAAAVIPLFAGPHEVAVTVDGEHLDVVLGHHHLNNHHDTHAHQPPHEHPDHQHSVDNEANSFLGEHHQPHPNHVFHLSITKSEPTLLSTSISPLYDDPGIYIHFSALEVSVTDFFQSNRSFKLLAHPPPVLDPFLKTHRTVVLLI